MYRWFRFQRWRWHSGGFESCQRLRLLWIERNHGGNGTKTHWVFRIFIRSHRKFVAQQLESVLSDIGADAVKTGMLLTAGVIQVVVKKIKEYNIGKVVIDPVMIAKGGRSLMQDKARESLVKKLLPLAFVVTPNIPEAENLAQMKIKSIAAMKKAAALIHKLGAKNVLIKGGHLPGGKKSGAIDILYDGDKYYEFSAPWIDSRNTHGTGCTMLQPWLRKLPGGRMLSLQWEKRKSWSLTR